MADLSLQIESSLRREFERTLSDRVRRASELQYQKIIGDHHFAAASWECLKLYRDGFSLGAIMASQAVVEALIKFVAKLSNVNIKRDLDETLSELRCLGILSVEGFEAAKRVWRFRNDFHHLNPAHSTLDIVDKAKKCVEGLCALEKEIFECTFENGRLLPKKPWFWNIESDGTAPVFLRQLDV